MPTVDLKRLREELECSIGELAAAVGVETKTLLAWEAGDEFPTKKHTDRLEALKRGGAAAFPRRPRGKPSADPIARLGDPKLWALIQKLLLYPELQKRVEELAAQFPDPPK